MSLRFQIYRVFRKTRRVILKKLFFWFYFSISFFRKPLVKSVYIDTKGLVINRYFANFCNYFFSVGFTIYLKAEEELIFEFSKSQGEFKYSNTLLFNNKLKFTFSPVKLKTDLQFNNLKNNFTVEYKENSKLFYCPIGKYPMSYLSGIKDLKTNERRKNSLFMIGNFNANSYGNIKLAEKWNNISNRVEVYGHIQRSKYFRRISNRLELEQFITSSEDQNCIIIDTESQFKLSYRNYLNTLVKFDFFLAVPGINIPFCHNLYEAMELGCIPVIQKCYAELLDPSLINGINAIVFDNLVDLSKQMKFIFELNSTEIHRMRDEVLSYYSQNLSPFSITEKLSKMVFENIFIQSE